MSTFDNTEVHSRTLTAFFDTRDAAERAVRDLERAGIPRQHITLVGGSSSASASSGASADRGFWEELKDFFLPDEDRYSYAEGLRRGGYLVSVRSDEANYNRVVDILDADGSVDMEERESLWRSEGWTGYQPTRTGAAAYTAGAGSGTASGAGLAGSAALGRETDSVNTGRDEVIPVYEEQIRVGKRDVSHGRVRIRSYVVETPVQENVTLRSESVQVERRPVDRPVTDADRLFQDRTIEAEQYAEEAVVQKDVRVKEEIGIRKVAEQRTETVSDKVRRTEVEVEDERGTVARDGTASDGLSGTTPNRRI